MSYRVLIVDDSKMIRAIVHKSLRMAKVPLGEVLEAENGQEALAVLGSHEVDIVFTDLNMPVMSGFEFIERLRADAQHGALPVVVISTEAGSERIHELDSLNVAGTLGKPFKPEEIRELTSRLLTGGGVQ